MSRSQSRHDSGVSKLQFNILCILQILHQDPFYDTWRTCRINRPHKIYDRMSSL